LAITTYLTGSNRNKISEGLFKTEMKKLNPFAYKPK